MARYEVDEEEGRDVDTEVKQCQGRRRSVSDKRDARERGQHPPSTYYHIYGEGFWLIVLLHVPNLVYGHLRNERMAVTVIYSRALREF